VIRTGYAKTGVLGLGIFVRLRHILVDNILVRLNVFVFRDVVVFWYVTIFRNVSVFNRILVKRFGILLFIGDKIVGDDVIGRPGSIVVGFLVGLYRVGTVTTSDKKQKHEDHGC